MTADACASVFYVYWIWGGRYSDFGSDFGSGFFDELGFELHGAYAGDFAVDVVISIDESDVFDFGSAFDDEG